MAGQSTQWAAKRIRRYAVKLKKCPRSYCCLEYSKANKASTHKGFRNIKKNANVHYFSLLSVTAPYKTHLFSNRMYIMMYYNNKVMAMLNATTLSNFISIQ
jgi:hypothetical protein